MNFMKILIYKKLLTETLILKILFIFFRYEKTNFKEFTKKLKIKMKIKKKISR